LVGAHDEGVVDVVVVVEAYVSACPKIKVVHFDELYNFHFDHFSRFQIDFELGIQIGKGGNF